MNDEDRKSHEENRTHLTLRPMAQIYTSYKAYKKNRDGDPRAVTIGRFIACYVAYDEDSEVSRQSQQKFWVGKVINTDEETIEFHYYHTSTTRNYTRAVFKPWTGQGRFVKVGHDAVFHVFDGLTDSGIIPAVHRRFILSKIDLDGVPAKDPPSEDDVDDEDDLVVSDVNDASDGPSDSSDDYAMERRRRKTRKKKKKVVPKKKVVSKPKTQEKSKKRARSKSRRGVRSKKKTTSSDNVRSRSQKKQKTTQTVRKRNQTNQDTETRKKKRKKRST
jgi:hypothetical protein